jgi:anti-sigma factor RsiW
MIDHNLQLKIQAFLDGELTGPEARDVAALIAANPEASALHAELKNTRLALKGAEADVKVPETREFYWSRISREISQLEKAPAEPSAPSPWQILAGWLKPLGAVAVVAIVGVLVWQQMAQSVPKADVMTAQVDDDTITFQDDTAGVTFVWLNYPAENGVANEIDSNTLN